MSVRGCLLGSASQETEPAVGGGRERHGILPTVDGRLLEQGPPGAESLMPLGARPEIGGAVCELDSTQFLGASLCGRCFFDQ